MVRDYMIIFGAMFVVAFVPAALLLRAHDKARRAGQHDAGARD
jgi:hypothetical protein